jgi:hypothetical protein
MHALETEISDKMKSFLPLRNRSFSMDTIYRRSTNNLNEAASLPSVFSGTHPNVINKNLRQEATARFKEHRLPGTANDCEAFRRKLKSIIIPKGNVVIIHQLPLITRERGSVQMKGYSIKKIAFQTRPGVFATANLYASDHRHPFPAAIPTFGHWTNGKTDESTGRPACHSHAKNSYVRVEIDAFGAKFSPAINRLFIFYKA